MSNGKKKGKEQGCRGHENGVDICIDRAKSSLVSNKSNILAILNTDCSKMLNIWGEGVESRKGGSADL